MTHDEAKKLVKLLAGLFPNQLTQDQARYAADRFRAYDEAEVTAAIKEHRAAHEFINWPQLFEGCKAASASGSTTNKSERPAPSLPDVIRHQRPDLAERSDFEVLLRYWWSGWHLYRAAARTRRIGMVAAMEGGKVPERKAVAVLQAHDLAVAGQEQRVLTGCCYGLSAAGMEVGAAERYARAVVRSEAADMARVIEDVREFGGQLTLRPQVDELVESPV